MPYQLTLHEGFSTGVLPASDPDQTPPEALRRGKNVRTDIIRGSVVKRPGSTQLGTTTYAAGEGRWLSKLYGLDDTYAYVHTGDQLSRHAANFSGAVTLGTVGSAPLSSANFVDGAVPPTPTKYLVNRTVRQKDDGTTYSAMGIPAPTATLSSAILGSRHSRVISAMDDHTAWTGTAVSGKSNETTIKQEGTGSVTFTVTANTLGDIASGLGAGLDLQNLPAQIDTALFVGSGLDDATAGGTYSGLTTTTVLEVEIDATGTPDTFQWRQDGGAWTTGVSLTGAAQALADGITITFAATTGHTLGDAWVITAHLADGTVHLDDYIQLRLRADRPDFLDFFQIDFDLDTATLASAFKDNYYSFQGSSVTRLNQGRDQWNHLLIRKAEFSRFGTDTSKDWSNVLAVRLSFLATRAGDVMLHVDDLAVVGGFGIEGILEYTAHYRNDVTKGRGNPPKDADGVVEYTTPLEVNRHPVILTYTNLLSGGIDHPGDTQIDTIWIHRQGTTGTSGIFRVASVADTSIGYTVDILAESALLLAPVALETDNDLIPTSVTVIFGPGGVSRLFAMDESRWYFSKAWEDDESRAENWPEDFWVQAGDGSEGLVNGLVDDTEIYGWTKRQTYRLVGLGEDTFQAIPVPDSRGLAARDGIAQGDGRIFFVSYNGIYEQVGLTQRKVAPGILDRFFAGDQVENEAGITQLAGGLAACRLAWFPQPHAPELVLLYPSGESNQANHLLVIKKNLQSGQYSDVFFDTYPWTLRALYVDEQERGLFAVADDGAIARLERPGIETDEGAGINVLLRTASDHGGRPRHPKTYTDVLLEVEADQDLGVTVIWDSGAFSESLGTLRSGSLGQHLLTIPDADAEHQDIALEIGGTFTGKFQLKRYGWHSQLLPDRLHVWESDELTFATIHRLGRFELDLDAPAVVTMTLWLPGRVAQTMPIAATTGRNRVTVPLPPGLKGKWFRVRLDSTAEFQRYAVIGWCKPLGSQVGYSQHAFGGQGGY